MSYRHDVIIYDPDEDDWYPIPGFPGYYLSISAEVWGPGRYGDGHIMKQIRDREGHLYVDLIGPEGIRCRKYIHRLMAEIFIPNPNNYPMVRHLDDCPDYNELDNLAWGTAYDNVHDAIRNRTAWCYISQTPIKAIDLITRNEYLFNSQVEAANTLGVHKTAINRVLRGECGQANGYSFEYLHQENKQFKRNRRKGTYAKVLATNLSTGEKQIFNTQKEAEEVLGIGNRMINRVLQGHRSHTHGYTFEYVFERGVDNEYH